MPKLDTYTGERPGFAVKVWFLRIPVSSVKKAIRWILRRKKDVK